MSIFQMLANKKGGHFQKMEVFIDISLLRFGAISVFCSLCHLFLALRGFNVKNVKLYHFKKIMP